jgi:hypothetical protein
MLICPLFVLTALFALSELTALFALAWRFEPTMVVVLLPIYKPPTNSTLTPKT